MMTGEAIIGAAMHPARFNRSAGCFKTEQAARGVAMRPRQRECRTARFRSQEKRWRRSAASPDGGSTGCAAIRHRSAQEARLAGSASGG